MDSTAIMALALQCAPTVHPATMAAIVSHESHNRVFAIGVNNGPRLRRQPADLQEASRTAARLIEQGYSIDLGLGQINSKNLVALGLDLRTVFEPCANLGASAKVLTQNYQAAHATEPDSQRALRVALSLYNTGNSSRGFRNGYVRKIEASAKRVATLPPVVRVAASIMQKAAWNVFGSGSTGERE